MKAFQALSPLESLQAKRRKIFKWKPLISFRRHCDSQSVSLAGGRMLHTVRSQDSQWGVFHYSMHCLQMQFVDKVGRFVRSVMAHCSISGWSSLEGESKWFLSFLRFKAISFEAIRWRLALRLEEMSSYVVAISSNPNNLEDFSSTNVANGGSGRAVC